MSSIVIRSLLWVASFLFVCLVTFILSQGFPAVAQDTELNPAHKIINQGYYRYPTICGNQVIFCCEDDLWSVSANGGIARRLTAGKGITILPRISPDASKVAFVSTEE